MKKIILALLPLLLFACDGGKRPDVGNLQEGIDTVKSDEPKISDEVIGDIIQQIPSPLEISVLLKKVGTEYDKTLLNQEENTPKYNSNYKKALNLGIYGTDLGYTNIYEQNQDALFYLKSIRELADGLSIGQFFDFGTIQRLATNSRNLDSLLLITTQNFNNINHYLQEQKRSNLSILLLTGGWLEALHISCQVLETSPGNKELEDKIGEQKIILENIMLLLNFYGNSDPSIQRLMQKLRRLKDKYDEVQIEYIYEESEYKVDENGQLIIIDKSRSEIKITPEQIQEITEIVKAIREEIIS